MRNLKLVLLTLLFATIAMAQTKGTLTGNITDKDVKNGPLAFATVFEKKQKTASRPMKAENILSN